MTFGIQGSVSICNQFSNLTTTPPSDVFTTAIGPGTSADFVQEIDTNSGTGFYGLRLLNVAGASQTWKMGASASSNAIQFAYQNFNILQVDSTNTLTFKGISSGFSGSVWTRQSAGVQTTTNATSTLATIPIATNEMITVSALISGFQSTFANGVGGNLVFNARRSGAGAVQVGTANTVVNKDGAIGASVTFSGSVSGNNAIITVTGANATTINWSCTYQVFRCQTNS